MRRKHGHALCPTGSPGFRPAPVHETLGARAMDGGRAERGSGAGISQAASKDEGVKTRRTGAYSTPLLGPPGHCDLGAVLRLLQAPSSRIKQPQCPVPAAPQDLVSNRSFLKSLSKAGRLLHLLLALKRHNGPKRPHLFGTFPKKGRKKEKKQQQQHSKSSILAKEKSPA